jgi:hypothetical protein
MASLQNSTRNVWFVPVLILVGFISCGPQPPHVVIRQGTPQQFILSGRGAIDHFGITGPSAKCTQAWKSERLPALVDYWQIEPLSETDVNRFSAEVISYGKVPEGFRQTIPTSGSPPPICEGGPYFVTLAIRNGGGVNMLFAVYPDKILSEGESQ